MKIREIDGVVLRLLKCRLRGRCGAAFVFDYEYEIIRQDNTIDAQANDGENILKKNRPASRIREYPDQVLESGL